MDVEINLVPFIDLLSCLVCFLLISAVWTQVARIDVKPAPNLPAEADPEPPKVTLKVFIKHDGYVVSDTGSQLEIKKTVATYPVDELKTKLEVLHTAYPDVTAITVSADDPVAYSELIVVMDLCLRIGLADISVSG